MYPLEGLKVVDLAVWLAAPTCAALLADCGAEVIKVESVATHGDPIRGYRYSSATDPLLESYDATRLLQISPLFEIANRGKRSIALDLSKDPGRRIFYDLIKETDVLVTNYRPPTLESLKVDAETLRALNPGLVYARMTGYGPKGPDRDKPGFDTTGFWSRSGLMALHGEPDAPPPQMHGSIGDFSASVFLFAGIMLALYQKNATGVGCVVDASLLSTGMWAAYQDIIVALVSGINVPRNSRKRPPNPLLNPYLCADGRWIHLCLLQTDKYWANLCAAIGRQDLIEDERFISHSKRCNHSAELVAILDEAIASRPFGEWAETFDRYNLVWAPVSMPTEVIKDPQIEANGYVVGIHHPNHGEIKELAPPFQLDGKPLCPGKRAPEFGESTEEILLRLGYSWDDIVRLKEEKLIL